MKIKKYYLKLSQGLRKVLIRDMYGVASVLQEQKPNGEWVTVERLTGWR